MFEGIISIVFGLISGIYLITFKAKDSEKILNIVIPIQGLFGFVAIVWGIWNSVLAMINYKWLWTTPVWWVTYFAVATIVTNIGFILAVSLMAKYVLCMQEVTRKKGEELLKKFSKLKIKLAVIALLIGLWTIIYKLFIFNLIKI